MLYTLSHGLVLVQNSSRAIVKVEWGPGDLYYVLRASEGFWPPTSLFRLSIDPNLLSMSCLEHPKGKLQISDSFTSKLLIGPRGFGQTDTN